MVNQVVVPYCVFKNGLFNVSAVAAFQNGIPVLCTGCPNLILILINVIDDTFYERLCFFAFPAPEIDLFILTANFFFPYVDPLMLSFFESFSVLIFTNQA